MHPVDALPTGTVTFLFTDIEGSTRLAERLGTATWSELLEAHQAILRQAFAASDGREIKTEGDSFFVVFRSAQAAVGASLGGQRASGASARRDGGARAARALRGGAAARGGVARPRRAPPEGPLAARADRPARHRRPARPLPGPEDAVQPAQQLARDADHVRRPGGGGGPGPRAPRGVSPADAHRARRHGQDPAVAAAGGGGHRFLPRRRLLRGP